MTLLIVLILSLIVLGIAVVAPFAEPTKATTGTKPNKPKWPGTYVNGVRCIPYGSDGANYCDQAITHILADAAKNSKTASLTIDYVPFPPERVKIEPSKRGNYRPEGDTEPEPAPDKFFESLGIKRPSLEDMLGALGIGGGNGPHGPDCDCGD